MRVREESQGKEGRKEEGDGRRQGGGEMGRRFNVLHIGVKYICSKNGVKCSDRSREGLKRSFII